MSLSKDDILNCNDLELESLEIPEWKNKESGDQTIFIKSLEDAVIKKCYSQNKTKGDNYNIDLDLIALSVCDENGNLIFDNKKDIPALGKKNNAVIRRIVKRILDINGLAEEGQREIEKNL